MIHSIERLLPGQRIFPLHICCFLWRSRSYTACSVETCRESAPLGSHVEIDKLFWIYPHSCLVAPTLIFQNTLKSKRELKWVCNWLHYLFLSFYR